MKTNISPPENIFSPQGLKPGYGPDSNTRVLQPCIVLKCTVIRPGAGGEAPLENFSPFYGKMCWT